MILTILTALLAMTRPQAQTAVDSAAVYELLLHDVRATHPQMPIVLAETRSGVACMPHCGARVTGEFANDERGHLRAAVNHSPGLLAELRRRGLIDATCTVPEATFGCGGHPGHLFVALGAVESAPAHGPAHVRGAFWVRVAVLVPCTTNCPASGSPDNYFPDAYGTWYLVARVADGRWAIKARQPAFAV